MHLVVRLDLDYVPWDTPDAEEFGHGEPAMILRLLDLARSLSVNFHFFASNRVLRAFPSQLEAILSDNHDLDWLCKHPLKFQERWATGEELFAGLGQDVRGLAVKDSWPQEAAEFVLPPEMKFLCAEAGPRPPVPHFFAVDTRSDRAAIRLGQSTRAWADHTKNNLRAGAALSKGSVLSLRPQVLAKFDPKLNVLRELLLFAQGLELKVATMRDLSA